MVRVRLSRLAVQPGGREEGWPGASWPGPLRQRGQQRLAHRQHRRDHPGPADRHQHHRPRGRGSPLRLRWSSLMLFAASTQTSIGIIILLISLVIAITFAVITIRQSKPEIGSEIELAPN